MKTRTIRQTILFSAAPSDVYELLMDQRKHSAFTGGRARISRKEGGKFSIYDGYITGENLELVQDERIVQTWVPAEDCWPEGHVSTAKFVLKPYRGGTRLTFTQTQIPVDCGDRFDIGWKEHYWTPMKKALKKPKQ